MGVLYIYFIPVLTYQQYTSIVPELGRETGTDDFESNALNIALAELILNGSFNIDAT